VLSKRSHFFGLVVELLIDEFQAQYSGWSRGERTVCLLTVKAHVTQIISLIETEVAHHSHYPGTTDFLRGELFIAAITCCLVVLVIHSLVWFRRRLDYQLFPSLGKLSQSPFETECEQSVYSMDGNERVPSAQ
jgi:hypothetical protein